MLETLLRELGQALLGMAWLALLLGAPGALLVPRLFTLRREDPIARTFLTFACSLPFGLVAVAIAAQASLQGGHWPVLLVWTPLIAFAVALVLGLLAWYVARARGHVAAGEDPGRRPVAIPADVRLLVPAATLVACVMLALVISGASAPQAQGMVEFSLPVEEQGFGAYILLGGREADVVVPFEVSNGMRKRATFMVCTQYEAGEFLWCSPTTRLEAGSVWRGVASVSVGDDLPRHLDLLLWVNEATEASARLRLWLQEAQVEASSRGSRER